MGRADINNPEFGLRATCIYIIVAVKNYSR